MPFFAPEVLQTDRFTIRSYRPGDGPALRRATVASYDHLRPWLAWATDEQSEDDAEHLARTFRANLLLGTDFTLAIVDPDDQRILGGTGFHLRGGALDARVAEIGMWIAADEAGQGLGSAVLRAMLGWGFGEWPWARLSWHCDSRNTASRRTAETAGMRLEGTLRGDAAEVGEGRRDTCIYGLTRDDAVSH